MAGIKNWATDDRPREKLMQKGAPSLSNSELLAILINNGTKDKSAVDLAKALLTACNNNLQRLGELSYKQITQLKIKGLGEAKAISIAAALELGIRRNVAYQLKEQILCSKDVANYMQAQLQHKQNEVFAVLLLNNSNKILHCETISEGGITGTIADPRIVFKKALEYNATNIILCHNHPSGNLKPSKQDEMLTKKIVEAARLLDMAIRDHVIVSSEGYFSFADNGLL